MLPDIEEQDKFYKAVYNDLSIIFEQSEQSVNFDELSMSPLKQSFAQLYALQDQKYQSSTEEENNSCSSYQNTTDNSLPLPSAFKRMVKKFNCEFQERAENIGIEADDSKDLQLPLEQCVKFIKELKQLRFKFNSIWEFREYLNNIHLC